MLAGICTTLVLAQGMRLEELDISKMTQEWGSPTKNQSVDHHPLSIGGRAFANGIGTHATSSVSVDLNGAESFSAWVGVDDETEKKGSVVFRVFLDGKLAAETPVMRGGDAARSLTVSLKGVKRMRLLVEDGGDGIDFDHADWADAAIVGGSPKLIGDIAANDPLIPMAKPDLHRTQINGPRVIGGTPGYDFVFRIPVSGARPVQISANGLPPGLRLDPATGVVSGKMEKAGTYRVDVTAKGKGGTDKRTITFVAGAHKLAMTPPMGWNSWNVWGTAVDAEKVRAAAKAFTELGLADYGYSFVNIDDAWEAGRDANGEILTNDKFPDMRNLSDNVHHYGLKLGIYSSPGPKTCGGYEGSYRHEEQDAKTWAKWGIDYLKHDWCSYGGVAKDGSRPELMKPYYVMREALDASGRDIVYSLCQYGMGDVHTWGNQVGADLWRTTGDITDTWGSMSSIGFSQSNRAPFSKPSGWNDPDMLVVGHLGWGPSIRPTRLKPNEQVTHITLWSMLAAPLLIGCDLTKMDDLTRSLLMNHDVVEIDQDPLGKAALPKVKDGSLEIWTRPLWDGTTAVALFNRGYEKAKMTAEWSKLGLKPNQPVYDCWSRKSKGTHAKGYTVTVPSHGAVLIRVGTMKN